MSAQGKKHRSRKRLGVAVLALLALLSIVNVNIVKEPLRELVQQDISFEIFVKKVQEGYISNDFAYKNAFLNLNGLFARLTGRRVLNEVAKLNNGMLGRTLGNADTATLANGISSFSDYLSERNIPFLYVQVPVKESLDGQSYPMGVTFYGNKNADSLLLQLSAVGVETLDLRPMISQTPEMLEQYFSKTDHHWNSDGAFVAFREILNCLHELLPEGNIDLTCAQADQWERHCIDNWFLGSLGKRVGIFFGGTDPLIWYTPKFETEMSCAIPKYGNLFRGDFAEANVRRQYIEEKDYFGYNAYCVYIGGDYPLVQHRNLDAPSPLKVLMIKDSFTLPLQAYLSTVFREIDVIDPRYFSECTIAEYVEQTGVDVVILAINPSVFGNPEYQNLGEKEAISIKTGGNSYEPVMQENVKIEAKNGRYNYAAYPLEHNAIYQVSFETVDIVEGESEGAGLCFYDKTTETVLMRTIFDIVYCKATNSFSWSFRTPDTQDELQLLFYAGIYGSTEGNSVIYQNVTVGKMVQYDP